MNHDKGSFKIPSFREFYVESNLEKDVRSVVASSVLDPRPTVVMGSLDRAVACLEEAGGIEPIVIDVDDVNTLDSNSFSDLRPLLITGACSISESALEFRNFVKERSGDRIAEVRESGDPKIFILSEAWPPASPELWNSGWIVLEDAQFTPENVARSPFNSDIEDVIMALENYYQGDDDVMNEAKHMGALYSHGDGGKAYTPEQAKKHLRMLIAYNQHRGRTRDQKKSINVLLVGKSGVGKTHVVEEVAADMGLNMAVFNVPLMDQWVELIGIPIEETETIAEGDGPLAGKARKYLRFVRESRLERANVIFWDELSYGTQDKFNAILKIVNEGKISGTKLENYFMSIAAMNPGGGEFEGAADRLGRALQRRFQVRMEIIADPNVEYLLSAVKGAARKDAETIVKWWEALAPELKDHIAPSWLDDILDLWTNYKVLTKTLSPKDKDELGGEQGIEMLVDDIVSQFGHHVFEGEPISANISKLVASLRGIGLVSVKDILKNADKIGTEYPYQSVLTAVKDEATGKMQKLLDWGEILRRLPWEQVKPIIVDASLILAFSKKDFALEKEWIKKALKDDEVAKFWVEKVCDVYRSERHFANTEDHEELKDYVKKAGGSWRGRA